MFFRWSLFAAVVSIVCADNLTEKLLEAFSRHAKGPLSTPVPVDADVGKDMVEISLTRGYHIESHYVTTEDGYILTMFNIPYGKKSGSTKRGLYPVLLQHGLWDSSYTWVSNFEDESLGFILADLGFDVWFGNNRGNRYGRNHTTLNPDVDGEAFWTFSWDEMAKFDVPAMINYVTSYTNTSSLSWVGHSEGTIQMFAAGTLANKMEHVKQALDKMVSFNFSVFLLSDLWFSTFSGNLVPISFDLLFIPFVGFLLFFVHLS
jgi:pimeloyl-ACP methyl ester carboxylesterase